MIIKEINIIPEHEQEVTRYRCDICGDYHDELGKKNEAYYKSFRWSNRLNYDSGHSYPEGESMEGEAYDICFGCMKTKVMPHLEKLIGKPPRKTIFDY